MGVKKYTGFFDYFLFHSSMNALCEQMFLEEQMTKTKDWLYYKIIISEHF